MSMARKPPESNKLHDCPPIIFDEHRVQNDNSLLFVWIKKFGGRIVYYFSSRHSGKNYYLCGENDVSNHIIIFTSMHTFTVTYGVSMKCVCVGLNYLYLCVCSLVEISFWLHMHSMFNITNNINSMYRRTNRYRKKTIIIYYIKNVDFHNWY